MSTPALTVGKDGQRIDQFLAEVTAKSREFVQEQIADGRVLCNGKTVAKASYKLKVGDKVEVNFVEVAPQTLGPVKGELDILFEDEALIVLNKPQGLVVHPASGHQGDTLVHYLLYQLQNHKPFAESSESRPGIVHRLDKGTSGVILIGKSREVQNALSAQFKARIVKKEYECIAWGKMGKQGKIDSDVGRDRRDRKKMSSRTDMGRDALTLWKATESFRHFTHVRLYPHTGRTHQLRVHLSETKHPIVSDDTYGKGFLDRNRRTIARELYEFLEPLPYPFLHAAKLSFNHPSKGDTLTFEAPRPEIFDRLLQLLKTHDSE